MDSDERRKRERREADRRAGKGELYRALVVTAEVIGHELGELAAEDMARELAAYPAAAVALALQRCKRELTGRLTLSSILQRIEHGHPGPEEAWALCPRDEAQSVVWTDEIAEAYAVAAPLLAQGDAIAGRMAFKEAYARLSREAIDQKRAPRWWPSFGHDQSSRATVVLEAVRRGRLTSDLARKVLGGGDAAERALLALDAMDDERKKLAAGAA